MSHSRLSSKNALVVLELKSIRQIWQSGRLDLAENKARSLCASYPRDAVANYSLAHILLSRSKKKEGLPFAEAAARLDPDNAEYLAFLGQLYRDFSLFDLALPVLLKANRLTPDSIKSNMALADYYSSIANGNLALSYVEKALNLASEGDEKASVLYAYAMCLISTGAASKAEPILETMRSNPTFRFDALVQLAHIGKHGNDSKIAELIRDELLSPQLNNEKRSALTLTLGHLHENSGNYETAFDLFTTSRLIVTSPYERDEHHRTIDETISFYPRKLFDSCADFGSPSDVPIYVVGLPRTGTTLTEQIIGSHHDAVGVGELPRMHRLDIHFRAQYAGGDTVSKVTDAARRGEIRARATEDLNCLQAVASNPKARHIVDKLPSNFLALGYIHLCFPKAKIVHCRRNAADSFVSSYQNRLGAFHNYAYDQEAYADYYLEKERLMAHWWSCFPENIFDLEYEKLIEEPERVTRELIDFLGLPWDDNCLRFFENQSSVFTLSRHQVRSPIYKSSVERWRRYEKQLQPLIKALNLSQASDAA